MIRGDLWVNLFTMIPHGITNTIAFLFKIIYKPFKNISYEKVICYCHYLFIDYFFIILRWLSWRVLWYKRFHWIWTQISIVYEKMDTTLWIVPIHTFGTSNITITVYHISFMLYGSINNVSVYLHMYDVHLTYFKQKAT